MKAHIGGQAFVICDSCGRRDIERGSYLGWFETSLQFGDTLLRTYHFCSYPCKLRFGRFWKNVMLLLRPNLEWIREENERIDRNQRPFIGL